jgi:hypothetical protein
MVDFYPGKKYLRKKNEATGKQIVRPGEKNHATGKNQATYYGEKTSKRTMAKPRLGYSLVHLLRED